MAAIMYSLKTIYHIYLFIYFGANRYGDQMLELVISYHVGLRDQTQIIWLDGNTLSTAQSAPELAFNMNKVLDYSYKDKERARVNIWWDNSAGKRSVDLLRIPGTYRRNE